MNTIPIKNSPLTLSSIIIKNKIDKLGQDNFHSELLKIGLPKDDIECLLNRHKQSVKNNMIEVIFNSLEQFINNFSKVSPGTKLPKHQPMVYGGYYRDYLAELPFNDLDIRFRCLNDIKIYIEHFLPFTCVNINNSYSYCGCVTLMISNLDTIDIKLRLDLTYPVKEYMYSTGEKCFKTRQDFDVNLLTSTKSIYNLDGNSFMRLGKYCQVENIIENCRNRRFVVLTGLGRPIIKHHHTYIKIYRDNFGLITSIQYNHPDNNQYDCISRNSKQGMKLLERIDKMINYGWTIANHPCENPDCILAPSELYEEYLEYCQYHYD
nr:hypothetical protein [Megavirus caiporensis]